MSFTVTVLGSSGSYAAPDNPCTGFLVQADGVSVLLDCGPGTLEALQQHVPLDRLSAIVCTHCHPDHWVELPVIRNALRYYLGIDGVPVYTTAATWRMADAIWSDGGESPTFVRSVITSGDVWQLGPLTFTSARTQHPVETLAVRIDAPDGSMIFSADTGPAWGLESLGAPVDLAVHEATVLHAGRGRVDGVHCSAREAGEAARRAGARRLVLTHLEPGSDPAAFEAEAAAAYGAPVHAARPGDVLIP